jgi:hypothetical protein
VGALFGMLASAVLYAPPELANQPPPWQHRPWDQGAAAAATHTAGAGPAQAPASAPVIEPAAAILPAVDPATPPQVAASAQPPAEVAIVSPAPAPKKRKVQIEVPAVDTSAAGAGPAPDPVRVEPEAPRAPAEYTVPRSDGETTDPSR